MRCAARAISARAAVAVTASMRPACLALFRCASAAFSAPVTVVAPAVPANVSAARADTRQTRPLTCVTTNSVADRLAGPLPFPHIEQPRDVMALIVVEGHQRDETACFGRIIVCYCGFEPFSLRIRLAELAAQPAEKGDAAHRTFTGGQAARAGRIVTAATVLCARGPHRLVA